MLSDADNSSQRSTQKAIISEFVDTTTINGLQRLFVKNKIRKNIWTVIVCLTFACFCVHFYYMLSNYLSYPTNTETSIKEANFEFPDVTICAKKPFDRTKTTKDQLGINQATRFWHHVFSDKIKNRARREVYSSRYARMSFFAYSKKSDVYLDIMKHVHYCMYNRRPCRESDFSVVHMPDRLNCITFHPAERSLTNSGRDNGLSIFLDTGPSFNVLSEYEEILVYDGFELIIHENGTFPDMSQQSFTIQKGKANDLSLTMGVYEKASTPVNLCRMKNDWDEWCLNPQNSSTKHMLFHKSRATCRIYRDQMNALNSCGCWRDDKIIPWKMNATYHSGNYPLCHTLPEHFFYNDEIFPNGTLLYRGQQYQLDDTNEDYVEVNRRASCLTRLKRSLQGGHIEDCDHACVKKYHVSAFSNADYKLDFRKFVKLYDQYYFSYRLKTSPHINTSDYERMAKDLDYGKNLMIMVVYATDLDVIHTKESLAYPLSNFFSDFGGNIGLWIGCTVITLAEIIEFIFRLSFSKANKNKNNRKMNEETQSMAMNECH